MLIASQDKSENQNLKSLLSSEFKMKHMRATKNILGMEIKKDRVQKKLFLCEKEYIQPIISLSTTKVESIVLEKAKAEGIQLKGIICNLGFLQDKAIIFCDNLRAICFAKDQVHHEMTKHIDYHFICTEKRIIIQKVDTKENPGDMFTKSIPQSKFMHYLDLLNVDCC